VTIASTTKERGGTNKIVKECVYNFIISNNFT